MLLRQIEPKVEVTSSVRDECTFYGENVSDAIWSVHFKQDIWSIHFKRWKPNRTTA